MTQPIVSFLLILGLLSSAAAAVPASAQLTLGPCQLEHPAHLNTVAAECGELRVPENPDEPGGRQVALHIARVPAINRRKRPDPLFVLAGGPGMAATTFYTTVAPAFERIHRDRDIVLVDQRGTGRSNALNCDLNDDLLAEETDAGIAEEARHCLKQVEAHANVAYYTTSIAVQDLDRARAALGYQTINLYGGSYGTRVAQQYLRRFPTHSRTVILDGVIPPTLALGPAVSVDAETALQSILTRCTREPECHRHFGDPVADYRKLRLQLQAQPVPVTIPDPTTGEASKLEFTSLHLATVLRLTTYSPQEAALLPLMLHNASHAGDFTLLAAHYLLVNRAVGDVIAYGMHNSVVCAEDVPFFDAARTDRLQVEQTYLGTSPVDGLRAVCQVWPRGPLDSDFHSPLHSDVPALLLSGSDDPATPAADGETARQGFTHGLHVTLKGFGHGQLTAPCMDRVLAQFVDRGSVDGLDVSCTRLDKPTPFFVSPNGPPP